MREPWRAAIISTLVLLYSSCGACGTKPDLNALGPDGRGCLVGRIDAPAAALLRVNNPAIQAGDVVLTPFCAAQIGEDLLNDIYELTR